MIRQPNFKYIDYDPCTTVKSLKILYYPVYQEFYS